MTRINCTTLHIKYYRFYIHDFRYCIPTEIRLKFLSRVVFYNNHYSYILISDLYFSIHKNYESYEYSLNNC